MKRFNNKVCLVTGGSSGIGKATALQLAAEGGKVAILSRTKEEGQATVKEIEQAGGEAIFISTDIGNVKEVQAAVDQIVKNGSGWTCW